MKRDEKFHPAIAQFTANGQSMYIMSRLRSRINIVGVKNPLPAWAAGG